MTATTHVVAGVLTDAAGRRLIAQRPKGKRLAGGWEFPGGKLEPGEERLVGLARELREELGVEIRNPRPLIRVRHAYAFGDVLLDIWVVPHYTGEPQGLDGQALRWLTQDELEAAELLPADGPIVAALRLPERLTSAESPHYEIIAAGRGAMATGSRLRGVLCTSAAEAAIVAGAGADFIVLHSALAFEKLAALCNGLAVPVYARGIGLLSAWTHGATGLNELDSSP